MNQQSICLDIDSSCPCNKDSYTPNGKATGKCTANRCEINGWCTRDFNPSEPRFNMVTKYDALLDNIDYVELSFQVNIEFPVFGKSKIVSANPKKFQYNYWRIGDLLTSINANYDDIRETGAIIVINMHWNCGSSIESCVVNWNIFRADSDSSEIFMYESNYQAPNIIEHEGIKISILETRYLQKIYGIKIMFNVSGEMKRFNIIGLLVNIGAMMGIMQLVPFFIEIVIRKRHRKAARMIATDVNEREELHDKFIKELLLKYLKGEVKRQ